MDITLLRTFLEVARTRHFGHAADALFVTQSAVSARIKLLESTLGVELFSRKRNAISLTPAGNRLRRHAETIVRGWERARMEVALAADATDSLALGCVYDLWPVLVRDWTLTVRRRLPATALQIELQPTESLLPRLGAGLLDLAFMFGPPGSEGLMVRQVAEVELVLVSTLPGQTAREALRRDYMMVDWGGAFAISHADRFPDAPAPVARLGCGSLALDLLRRQPGAAYLARQLVEQDLADETLFRVEDAPVVRRYAYAVYPPETERRAALQALFEAGDSGRRPGAATSADAYRPSNPGDPCRAEQ